MCVCVCVQLCPTICDPLDYSPPGSSDYGIFQARILERVAISSSRNFPDPGIEPASPVSLVLAGGFFTTMPPGKPLGSEGGCKSKKKKRHKVLFYYELKKFFLDNTDFKFQEIQYRQICTCIVVDNDKIRGSYQVFYLNSLA